MTKQGKAKTRCNWGVVLGTATSVLSFVIGTVLIVVDIVVGLKNPYAGVVAYMIVPVMFFAGAGLAVLAWLCRLIRKKRRGEALPLADLDLRTPLIRRRFIAACALLPVLLITASVGGYRAYHFVESVEFCGVVCHSVMEPEHTTFHNSPHAGIKCSTCHVGEGFKWFIRTKIQGAIELYSLAFNKYERPLKCPIENLRPADETCGRCHWREKSYGDVLRTWTHFMSDETNTPWTIVMKTNLGGGDPEEGPIFGIHWHVGGAKVEYVSENNARLIIPWVRVTHRDGSQTVYRTTEEGHVISDEEIAALEVREMDCTDCHNRPSHRFLSPNDAVEAAMLTGKLPLSLSCIKEEAGLLLDKKYESREEGLKAIAEGLRDTYEDEEGVEQAVAVVQEIYRNNFFPNMKADWRAYPHHIGHKWSPGCFRCHEGKHVSEDGRRIVHGCGDCHTIIAQGPGLVAGELSPKPLEFKHPEDIDEEWKTESCVSCHTGAP